MRAYALPSCLLWLAQAQALALPQIPRQEDAQLERRQEIVAPTDFLPSYASEDIIAPTETVKVSTTVVPTGVVQILPSLSDVEPHTEGVIITEVKSISKNILLTNYIPSPTSLLQPLASPTKAKRDPEDELDGHQLEKRAGDIFAVPIATTAPPASIARRADHPCPRKDISKSGPLQTNKFFSNFFLGDQSAPNYIFPYTLTWAKGGGPASSWGLAISHIEAKQRAFGPIVSNKAAKYFINPVGIQSMILSAVELGKSTVLTTDMVGPFSARVSLKKDATSEPVIQFPLNQGMVYVTGRFRGGTPLIQSGVYFKSMTKVTTNPKANVVKYNFILEDNTTWRVYAYNPAGDPLDLQMVNNGLARSKKPFQGIIQIAKDPLITNSERVLDDGAGIYPNGSSLTGTVSGTTGTYTFNFVRAGHSTGNLYMYALPHHIASFDANTKSRLKPLLLQTTVKGVAQAIIGNTWTMVESALPTSIEWAPYDGAKGGPQKKLSAQAKADIAKIALLEVSQDMKAQLDLGSMYFSGKTLLKFAQIVYVINDLLGNTALAQAALIKLKEVFAIFANNQQTYPLVYESAWGGVISNGVYVTGNPMTDFGNSYYNDHHFHYGYHILAAAYIGHLDKAWAAANKDYVNTLVRDIANPSKSDTWFPQHRAFDWYHGHSWATGLFAEADGKNHESSSEDVMAAYAIRMWGRVIADTNMADRATLQLAVLTRSLASYYLYTADNKIQPSNFIGNKVAGILYENKIDHTTFFGDTIHEIQGIHMIPIHAPTALTRNPIFTREEWVVYFANKKYDANMDNGWKGIIYANLATIEPKKSYDFFNATNFQSNWIDGGASRTWYMTYAAALGAL